MLKLCFPHFLSDLFQVFFNSTITEQKKLAAMTLDRSNLCASSSDTASHQLPEEIGVTG